MTQKRLFARSLPIERRSPASHLRSCLRARDFPFLDSPLLVLTSSLPLLFLPSLPLHKWDNWKFPLEKSRNPKIRRIPSASFAPNLSCNATKSLSLSLSLSFLIMFFQELGLLPHSMNRPLLPKDFALSHMELCGMNSFKQMFAVFGSFITTYFRSQVGPHYDVQQNLNDFIFI